MTTRIVADILIPGRGQPIEHGTVILMGEQIRYAGPTSKAPTRAPDEKVHEVPAVLPGLWDSHAHFVGLLEPNLEHLATLDIVTATARSITDAGHVLDAGVTSVREVGGLGLRMARAVDEGSIRGPRIFAAGRILSTTGGHADIHALPINFAHDLGCRTGFSILCDGIPDVLRAVRTNLRANARLIKVCASGGVISEVDHPIHQQFSDEELTAIVGEARRAERIVAAHCHGKPGIMAALHAGCHTIEHGSYLDEEAVELMLQKNAMLVPTRFVVNELLRQADALPSYVHEKIKMVGQAHEEALKVAVAKKVRIAMGCDIFLSGPLYGQNGREILNLIEAGMSDLEAIEAATANGPDTLGWQAPKSGQLREGYDGDVIALDASPLDDRSVWSDPARVTHVWRTGQQVK